METQGFSLIEVLIALALATGMAVVLLQQVQYARQLLNQYSIRIDRVLEKESQKERSWCKA